MRSLELNKQTLWYAQYVGSKPLKDEDGRFTGERTIEHTAPVKYRISISNVVATNISRTISVVRVTDYGNSVDYDKTLCTTDLKCPINESSVLWIDNSPENGEPYDYIVRRVSRSINSVTISVAKVRDEVTR